MKAETPIDWTTMRLQTAIPHPFYGHNELQIEAGSVFTNIHSPEAVLFYWIATVLANVDVLEQVHEWYAMENSEFSAMNAAKRLHKLLAERTDTSSPHPKLSSMFKDLREQNLPLAGDMLLLLEAAVDHSQQDSIAKMLGVTSEDSLRLKNIRLLGRRTRFYEREPE